MHGWPQILHLQEVKIKASDKFTLQAVKTAVNSPKVNDEPSYEVRFCLPKDKHHGVGNGGKVYGVATIISTDFMSNQVSQIREVNWDKEGRVLIVETRSKLSIWNVYAVNGTSSPWRDSETGHIVGTRNDRKLAFHKHLMNECKELESKGWDLILCGDFNVARHSMDGYPALRTKPEEHVLNRKDFNSKFFEDPNGLCLVDSFRCLHPQLLKYTWINNNQDWLTSCDRVDYILLSKRLIETFQFLREADILMTLEDQHPSDHVPIYIELCIRTP